MAFSQDLETFVDQYFSEQMSRLNIPGAVFVLVRGEELVLAKGYGWANLAKQITVTPERTLFRVGSISKLVTATAIMQLVEAGKLNLFADINQYLSNFRIEDKYSQPITTAHLLTHTAGFDEHTIGLETINPSELISLGEYLATRMPPLVMPPGKIISYSNHGMGLAGYLVEVIANIPFEQYVQEHIFQPLEMCRSSFQFPDHLAEDLAVGYEGEVDNYQAVPFSYIKIPPGGSLIATATDIAHFMMAHLQNGSYENRRILYETTAKEMHRQQFTNHASLPGFTYGFYEKFKNNQRLILHGGTVRGFASMLCLLPEQNLGFFIAGNSLEFQLVTAFTDQFLDRYYPRISSGITPPVPSNYQPLAQDFAGYYQDNRYSRNTIQKFTTLFEQIRVSVSENSLRIPDFSASGETHKWVEIAPRLFQCLSDESYLAFGEDRQGKITYLFQEISTFEKLAWYETRPLHLAIFGFCILTFLATCILNLNIVNIQTIPQILSLAIAFGNLVFVIGFILASANPNGLTYGIPKILLIVLCVPILTTVMTVGLIILLLLTANNAGWNFWQWLYYSLVTVAGISFTLWLRYWNLLGFKFW